ncbi:MAG: hypothetical protein HC850_01470 [Rhodomicrobium sp.]|nr:hypothetical protein [Rhodomicrobium sp.]
MVRSVYALVGLAALLAASQASALQLTNRDTEDRKITITEKEGSKDLIVKPSQVIDDVCKAGCTIKTADGEEYEFDGNEVVSIEEGLMFLDEPSDAGAPDEGNPDSGKVEPDGAEKKPQ